jgi:tetratricopeptide (TPR) repeat protein
MGQERYNVEFLTPELTIRLWKDFKDDQYEAKIALIREYAASIQSTLDPEVFEVKLNEQIGLCYYMGGQYQETIDCHKIILEILTPEDSPMSYFLTIGLIIRCSRLIGNFDQAFFWAKKAFAEVIHAPGFNFKLDLLQDYGDLISDSKQEFDQSCLPIIQSVIDEAGFPQKLADPVSTINSMREMHLYWNRKLMEFDITHHQNKDSLLEEYQKYHNTCEIGWYRDYADKLIFKIKKEKDN